MGGAVYGCGKSGEDDGWLTGRSENPKAQPCRAVEAGRECLGHEVHAAGV